MRRKKTEPKLGIRYPYVCIPLNENELCITTSIWNNSQYLLIDTEKTNSFANVGRLISGRYTLSEIAKKLDCSVSKIKDSLDPIDRLSLIENVDENRVSSAEERIAKQTRAYSTLTNQNQEKAIKILRKSHVAVIGTGVIGLSLLLKLVQLGISHFTIVDVDFASSFHNSKKLRQIEMGNLVDLLNNVGYGFGHKMISINDNEIVSLERSLTKCNFVIAALDSPTTYIYDEINQMAVNNSLKWTIVTFDGTVGIVGPTFIPPETACYNCFESRLISNLDYRDYTVYRKLKKAVKREHISLPFTGLLPHAEVITSLLASDVPSILSDGSGFTVGKTIWIDFANWTIKANDLLKLPRCRICGRIGMQDPNKQLFLTYQRLMEENDAL